MVNILFFFSSTHLVCLQGLALHVEVPDFSSQVVSGEQVAATVAELNIWDGGDDLGEEGAGTGILRLFKHWRRVGEKNGERRTGLWEVSSQVAGRNRELCHIQMFVVYLDHMQSKEKFQMSLYDADVHQYMFLSEHFCTFLYSKLFLLRTRKENT